MSNRFWQWVATAFPTRVGRTDVMVMDLGSATTRLRKPSAEWWSQPTCALLHEETGQVLSTGRQAGRGQVATPQAVKVVWPIRQGVVAEPAVAVGYLSGVWSQFQSPTMLGRLLPPTVVVTYPSGAAPVDQATFSEVCHQAGAGRVILISKGEALIKRWQQVGKTGAPVVLIDYGHQTIEIVVTANQELLMAATLPQGGEQLTTMVTELVAHHHHCLIGQGTAETVKHQLVTISPRTDFPNAKKMVVRGKDLVRHLPVSVTVETGLFHQPIQAAVQTVMDQIMSHLSRVPAETLAQAFQTGIFLTGGGARLSGLDELLAQTYKTEVMVSQSSEWDVVMGASRV